jgi:hypothetical protein
MTALEFFPAALAALIIVARTAMLLSHEPESAAQAS